MKNIGIKARFWAENCPTIKLVKAIKDKISINRFSVISPDGAENNWESVLNWFYTSKDISLVNYNTDESIIVDSVRESSYISIAIDNTKIDVGQIMDSLLSKQEFILAHIYDFMDEYWQGSTDIQSYELYNKPYAHLPKSENVFGDECIDVSKNYGRMISLEREQTMAAPINYYGKMFFELIPKEYIASYNHFYSYEDYGDYVKCVLFENIFESEKNRKLQEDYFKYLKLEELSALMNDYYACEGFPFDGYRIDERTTIFKQKLMELYPIPHSKT